MDPISQVASSVQAVNDIMQNANQKTMDHAKKLVQVNAEMAVGKEGGKGGAIDLVA